MIIRYLDYVERLEFDIIQRQDEGMDVTHEKSLLKIIQENADPENTEKNQQEAKEIMLELSLRPLPEELVTNEPNDLEGIKRVRPSEPVSINPELNMDKEALYDATLGAWLGRAAGCLLGKPIERYHRTIIREMLDSNDSWPLVNYFTEVGMPADLLEKYPWKRRLGFESLRENIECMPEDDDLNYTMLNLHILETFGPGFTSDDVATTWLTKFSALELFTAERIAYSNLLNGLSPPESAQYLNPYREWIGGQIRADFWGYACPGNPEKAAEFSWRDTQLTHTRTGIYGGMFFAAINAAAFIETDMRKLIQMGLDQIPLNSRFSKAINFVLDISIEETEWEAVVDTIYASLGHYHWVHTINNAALTVAALIKGGGDYEQTICNAVMGGWDTDCNGATSGSIVGIVNGANRLPLKWIQPLNNQIRSGLTNFDRANFTDLARRTNRVVTNVNAQSKSPQMTAIDDF
ncbi:MAG: ADP-ribosylglycohydrolase family protein [Candidatus Marinimicrobia bacterium]|jgi:ADP-ribosylglycohydrolase|nr:ADP-ribosylglycohydrolase family protein [Candidatus Neomarinimicrobiota bacterium]MBT3825962.1 ADP-ribosylglycohydrolase family protein [Candidatus Neomarinimicrobiota bacterium]MBT4131373.1 ADP-ribosylglycohydrolase family protein [Candidatus Neomarinimicrobiota bacterium]MBT4296296.1 ADP-ribosylglycohydrolase family protein [Candidatus Neomarinimicrobiota bacterium]MBT4421405.1 ADP-ribosylglycohydrolase family protein [Candidatus Neomarinimicrobiota bacterium]